MTSVDPDLIESTVSAESERIQNRLLAGDETVFRSLVVKHHAAMVRFAMGFVRSRAAAEEVVQDTWLAVLQGIDRFEARSSIATWMYGILANKAKTRGVRDARDISFSELVTKSSDDKSDNTADFDEAGFWKRPPRVWDNLDPERIVQARQVWAHVGRILDELPPMQRAVVVLNDIEGRDSVSVCEILQLSDANRRVLLHRARTKIRSSLEAILAPAKA